MNANYKILILLFTLFLNCISIAGDANFSSVSRGKTLSLNGMYFAGADGLQPVLGNPSLLSLLNSKGIEVYIVDNMGQYEFENMHNKVSKSFLEDDFSFGGGLFWNFSPSFTAALSFQRTSDYNVNWPYANFFNADSLSSLLTFDFFNEFSIDAASVSFAYSFDNISLGASANIYYVEHHSSFPRSNEKWAQGQGQAGYQFNYSQDGYTFGFNLGASFQLNDQIRIGVMGKSGYKTDLEGSASGSMFTALDSAASVVNLSSTFEMPWEFGGGLVYEMNEDITINLDMKYSLWGGIQKSFDLTFDNPVWQQNLSSVDSLTGINGSSFNLSFNNSFDAGVGLEYRTSDVVLRTGYRFSQSPNTDPTYNMLFPSVDQHWISLGIGYQYNNLIIDASVAYAFGISTRITKASINNLSGRYSSSVVLPSVTLRYLL